MTDQEIITALQQDGQVVQSRVVTDLLRKIRPGIVGFVSSNSGTTTEGREVAQEVVVALWEALLKSRYTQQEEGKLTAWCHSVGRHLWLKRLRERKRQVDNPVVLDGIFMAKGGTPLEDLISKEDDNVHDHRIDLAKQCLKQLDPKCQQLLELDLEDTPVEAIATELKFKNVDSVKVKRCRCVKRWIELYRMASNSPDHG